jgi:hypothetical protein
MKNISSILYGIINGRDSNLLGQSTVCVNAHTCERSNDTRNTISFGTSVLHPTRHVQSLPQSFHLQQEKRAKTTSCSEWSQKASTWKEDLKENLANKSKV